MLNNENMNATLSNLPLPRIEEVEAHDPHIFLPLVPGKIRGATLQILLMFTERDDKANGLRSWLKECTLRERGRRQANKDNTSSVCVEASAWVLPWHTFNDLELCEALCASWSWAATDWSEFSDDANAVIAEIHSSVAGACAARLRELHEAIQQSSQQRNG